jgi:DNA-binding winged helix-turn-helix (wHTH) protein
MIYQFGDCELDTDRFEMRRSNVAQPLEPQVFDLLRFLVEHPDRMISRDEIFEAVWKGRIVSDAALSSRVKAARQAIGDDGDAQRMIRTVRGRGFRFVAPVALRDEPQPAPGPAAIPSRDADAGRAALARHSWDEAYRRLSAADAEGPLGAGDLERLAEAAFWTGRLEALSTLFERAYEIYIRERAQADAARVSLRLAEQSLYIGTFSVARGWLQRSQRLLQPLPPAAEHNHLARFQGRILFEREGDLDRASACAEEAHAVAVKFGDRDLEMTALHDQGAYRLARGEIEAGFALMEEASAAAMGGELGAFATGRIYCNMIDMCMRYGDYRRAAEWDEEAARWCSRVGHNSGFPGVCRVRRAEIQRLRGDWDAAEAEARRACTELEKFRAFAGLAFYEVGELILGRGDFAEAEAAFRRAHELGRMPQPGLARLRLAEGNVAAAGTLIAEALSNAGLTRLDRARILPMRTAIALVAGDVEAARGASAELRAIANAFRSAPIEASALQAEGAVRHARGDAEGAIDCLRRACTLWNENALPLEEARARLALGVAYRASGLEELAGMEIEAASASFNRLGATLELRHLAKAGGAGWTA